MSKKNGTCPFEDLRDLSGYDDTDDCCECEFTDKELAEIDEDILPNFNLSHDIIFRLAYIKRELVYLARNLETENDVRRTKLDLIALQEKVDDVVSEYALNCVDDFIFG